MERINVAIIGGMHHNTLGVIRSLGEKGVIKDNISVLVLNKKGNEGDFLSYSKYVDRHNVSFTVSDDGIIPWLLLLATDGKRRTVICCSDGSAREVISHKDVLSDSFDIPDSIVRIEDLMSKETQDIIANECGFLVPRRAVVTKSSWKDWDIFPCITKPIISAFASKDYVQVANNQEELASIMNSIDLSEIQVQEYIKKDFEFQLIGCSLNSGETIIIPGFTHILRQPENTNTGYLKYSPISSLVIDMKKVEKFINRIGYSGLFSIEFIRDYCGDAYFLEINLRNDGNAYCVCSAGINLPYIWCFFQTFNILPKDEILSFNKSIHFIPDFSDFSRGVKTVGVFKWIHQFIQAESHSIYNKKDMMPFFIKMRDIVLRKMIK